MGDLIDRMAGWYNNPDYAFEVQYIFGLMLCIVSGFVIGSEREKSGKPAGISTHTLVLMGSMLFTMISQLRESTPNVAAYIVSGVGFLGAGMIMKSDGSNKVSNLTTAAGVWVSAGIGMCIGYKLYAIAIITAIVASIGLHLIPHPKVKKPKGEGS